MKRKNLSWSSEVSQKSETQTYLALTIISLILLIILLIITWSPLFAQETDHKLGKIKAQIHILNLLNGLELDHRQMQMLLGAAKEAQEIRLQAKEKIIQREDISQAYQDVLTVAKMGSPTVPENIAQNFHRSHQEVDRIRETVQTELTTLTSKVKDNFKPHQIYVLKDYRPCIIPPVQKGRIGQAEDHGGFVKILERIRIMPLDLYQLQRETIAKRAIDKVKQKVPPAFLLDEEEMKIHILKTMDEVRTMSDVDFVMKKEETAKNLKTHLLPEKPSMNIGVKIERFLLHTEIIPILEERIKSGNAKI